MTDPLVNPHVNELGPLAENGPVSTGLHILLVENHPDSRTTLTMLLEDMGHTVTCAVTVGEALEAFAHASFEVLLSDIGLPDGDGWDLLSRLVTEKPPYAIAMSGFGMQSDRDRSQQAGYRQHLTKPLDVDMLETALTEAAREVALR